MVRIWVSAGIVARVTVAKSIVLALIGRMVVVPFVKVSVLSTVAFVCPLTILVEDGALGRVVPPTFEVLLIRGMFPVAIVRWRRGISSCVVLMRAKVAAKVSATRSSMHSMAPFALKLQFRVVIVVGLFVAILVLRRLGVRILNVSRRSRVKASSVRMRLLLAALVSPVSLIELLTVW
jgi:hypothetical protein